MNVPSAVVARSFYRVYTRVGGGEPINFESLPTLVQAQWEAVVHYAAALAAKAANDEAVDFDGLENHFPAGWLPRRLEED